MAAGFGPDFLAARRGVTYDATPGQSLWLAIVFCLILFLLNAALQGVFMVGAYGLFFGSYGELLSQTATPENTAKAAVVGLLPAGLLAAAAAYWLAGLKRQGPSRGLPLHVPDLGAAGWALLLGGFAAAVYVLFVLVFTALGIDPQTYAPTPAGVGDESSHAGLVEKAIADLADEPLLFALALPGVAIAVPVAEELIFRGALFSALVRSPVGRVGAVVITAFVWAVVHAAAAPWLFVGIIFGMGLILGWLLLRFGSLIVPIVCHCLWNGISSLAIFGNMAAS